MSQEDYKRGVVDTTAAFTKELGYIPSLILTVEAVKKKLLTVKVTKWVNVYDNENRSAYWYDTEEEAHKSKSNSEYMLYIGTYPVEIDLPL